MNCDNLFLSVLPESIIDDVLCQHVKVSKCGMRGGEWGELSQERKVSKVNHEIYEITFFLFSLTKCNINNRVQKNKHSRNRINSQLIELIRQCVAGRTTDRIG